MKRARFMPEMDLDDDAELKRRRTEAPQWQSHLPPPPPAPLHRTPGFFGLPPELRTRIYNLVLDSERVSPPAAPLLGNHQALRGNACSIRYPARYKAWRWPPGYWAGRRLRNELTDLVTDRINKRLTKAELDIMVNGYVFFPTWLHLPPDLHGDIPIDLDVSLRLFSCEAFKSNDGWPRQPGAGFRTLLTLLSQFFHEGPSFGQHFDILTGRVKWSINTLRINVTFHDPYTPATWPDAVHQIFRQLKALATSGLANSVIRTIQVHCTYTLPDSKAEPVTQERTWPVAPRLNGGAVQEWREFKFLKPQQRTLADDPRDPWTNSSGRPPPAEKLVVRTERRDSPFGVISPAGQNPQSDDYGLITLPTPRSSASMESNGMAGKRRSTPVPPPSHGLLDDYTAVRTPINNMLDDYSIVKTPMNNLFDDYSIAKTPVPGGATDDDYDEYA